MSESENRISKVNTPHKRLKLIALMDKYSITAKNVGQILGRSERTVLIWRCNGGKEIPSELLELLTFKLEKESN